MSPLTALSGHNDGRRRRPLLSVKRTSGSAAAMSADDPWRTCLAKVWGGDKNGFGPGKTRLLPIQLFSLSGHGN
jgi:hypothetical protein